MSNAESLVQVKRLILQSLAPQPVTYVCRNRINQKDYFYIVFDIIDTELIAKRDGGHLAKEGQEGQGNYEEQVPENESQDKDDMGVD